MSERILHQYRSRRNCAQLIKMNGTVFVEKQFPEIENFRRELQIYRKLQGRSLPHAQVISAADRTLLLTHLPGKNLVEILDTQESTGTIDWHVWDKLVKWIADFYCLTGFVMTDVNLRNFLYDDAAKTLYGLDFEECTEGDPALMVSRLAAFIRTYAPENTPLKQEIAEFVLTGLSRQISLDLQILLLETQKQEALLLMRRRSRI